MHICITTIATPPFEMCGVIAFLGAIHNGMEFVVSGLKLLQNRGYDSVGISYIPNIVDDDFNVDTCGIQTIKYASTMDTDALSKVESEVLSLMPNTNICIAHTRWATHGGKTDKNAHPHNDYYDKISIVHNGIIENYQELKRYCENELGAYFKSQTDTEVVAVLIGHYYQHGYSMSESVKKTLDKCSGTWALVIMNADFPNKLWVTRNGSPLLLGLEENFIMIVSEQIAFGNNIKKYIVLENHDIIEVSIDRYQRIQMDIDIAKKYTIQDIYHVPIEYTPTGYADWMLKEIMEQSAAVNRAMNNGGRIADEHSVKLGGLDRYADSLLEIDNLILLGCGTSYNAGLWSLEIFKQLDIFDTISIYDGAEFTPLDIPRRGKTACIFLSQSGETKDLHRCISITKEYNILSIGVVNIPDSMIARETDCGVYLNAGREVAVASTKSFTNQCVVLSMIAIWFSQKKNTCLEKRKRLIRDLQNLPFQIQQLTEGFRTSLPDDFDNILSLFNSHSSVFLLGKGTDYAIAKEGALKMKEVSYIHAEGYSASALKHGPFALITPQLPIILLDTQEKHRDKIKNTFQEVVSRDASVIMITNMQPDYYHIKNDNVSNRVITNFENASVIHIPQNKSFDGVLANCYLQLLSYYLAKRKGISPDFPRNLAKVVSVE